MFRQRLMTRFSTMLPPATETLSYIDWGRHYLRHYFQDPPSRMHDWMNKQLSDANLNRRSYWACILGPRGGAKSTYLLALILKRALSGRESYIIIVSDTVTQAVEHLRSIKEELESNGEIAHDYPDAAGVGPIWQEKMIRLRNGCVIRAAGTLSRIRGMRRRQFRPSLIVLDDPENDMHITSTLMRQRTRFWFERTLIPMGDAKTNVLAAGTSLHRESLVMHLNRSPGWTVNRVEGRPAPFRSIVEWPKRMDLWEAWEQIYLDVDTDDAEERADAFYRKNARAMNDGAVVLWPEREPLIALMKMRAEIGHTAFEAEKQNNPINPETCEWPEEYFNHPDFWFREWPKVARHVCRVVALDPSKGADAKHGDYSSFAKLVICDRGHYWVDVNMARRSTDTIVTDGARIVKRFKPQRFGCESNAFQFLLKSDFEETFAAEGIDVPTELIENKVRKLVRIRRLGQLLARKRIHFRAGSQGSILCVQQMRDFPNGDHDDGPDSVEMATRLAADFTDTFEPADDIGDTLETTYGD